MQKNSKILINYVITMGHVLPSVYHVGFSMERTINYISQAFRLVFEWCLIDSIAKHRVTQRLLRRNGENR